MKPLTDQNIQDLTNKLDHFLNLSDRDLILNYVEYRELLRSINKLVSLEPKILPLFPERQSGVLIQRAFYKFQGKLFSSKDNSKTPFESQKESWIFTQAKVTELSVLDKYTYRFTYEYSDTSNKHYKHVIDFGAEGMHASPWHWDEVELKNFFSPGCLLSCYVSGDNAYRHHVFKPYSS